MFRSAAARIARRSTGAIRRSYSSTPSDKTSAEAHKLAEEALAQKTGTTKSKATLPKGDKKPAKAAGESDGHWKAYAAGAGAATGAILGGLFYYGEHLYYIYETQLRHTVGIDLRNRQDDHSTTVERTRYARARFRRKERNREGSFIKTGNYYYST